MQEFDIIVVGSGSGLEVSAAVDHGRRVAVIDVGPFGGTCLNRGCIPSKMLIHSADLMEQIRGAHHFGIDVQVRGIDWETMVRRVSESVDTDARAIEQGNRQSPNVTVFKDAARFIDKKVLTVGDSTIHAETIVIAAGSRPQVPEIPGLAGVPYLTSDDAMRLERQPRSMVVLGGGATAVEFAHFFGTLGTEVTVVQRGHRLLSREDDAVGDRLTEVYSRRVRVLTDSAVRSVRRDGNSVAVEVSSPDGDHTLSAEALLVALGRVPNTDVLATDRGGVALDAQGFVRTDEYLETNVPGVWALGDIVGKYLLKHSANLEAAYAAHNILYPDEKIAVDYNAMPQAIFSSPQVASVGLTERAARERGRPYLVSEYRYDDTAFGAAVEDHDGFVKALADAKTREILGCHIVGTDATVLIQEAALAMRMRAKVEAITGAIYAHPALPEVVQRAFGSLHEPEQSPAAPPNRLKE
ncbi:MAG: dihydrolipoyl dehydrogenase [Dehalococcoidia bacterium]|nr:MAG: dihydrolipoyl dehydrogenase [Dehalococcoidia bacterium]